MHGTDCGGRRQKNNDSIADVGSAYLNAHMPQNDPKKFVFMMIAPNVAQLFTKLIHHLLNSDDTTGVY